MVKKTNNVTISLNKELIEQIKKLANSYREYNKNTIIPEYSTFSSCCEDLLKRGFDNKMKEDQERFAQWQKRKE